MLASSPVPYRQASCPPSPPPPCFVPPLCSPSPSPSVPSQAQGKLCSIMSCLIMTILNSAVLSVFCLCLRVNLFAFPLGIQDSCAAVCAFLTNGSESFECNATIRSLCSDYFSLSTALTSVQCAKLAGTLMHENPAPCMVLVCAPGRPPLLSMWCRYKAFVRPSQSASCSDTARLKKRLLRGQPSEQDHN